MVLSPAHSTLKVVCNSHRKLLQHVKKRFEICDQREPDPRAGHSGGDRAPGPIPGPGPRAIPGPGPPWAPGRGPTAPGPRPRAPSPVPGPRALALGHPGPGARARGTSGHIGARGPSPAWVLPGSGPTPGPAGPPAHPGPRARAPGPLSSIVKSGAPAQSPCPGARPGPQGRPWPAPGA